MLDEVTQVDACVKVKGLNKEQRSVQEFVISRFPLQSGKLQATCFETARECRYEMCNVFVIT